jgi:hypothetical protein
MVGAALCGAVLFVIGIISLNPVARPHLDRVSFRILVCALLAKYVHKSTSVYTTDIQNSTVFGVTNAVGGKFKGPTWACGFTIFLLQVSVYFSIGL